MPATLDYIDCWDVGQGDATVINFTDGSIGIIDVGPMRSPLVQWLADRPRSIKWIVLTHNDADHAGALCSIVADHKARIEKVFLLIDRTKDDPRFQRLFRCANEAERTGSFKIEFAVKGQELWRSDDGETKLMIIHPGFSEVVLASTPNRVCAMVVLTHKDQTLMTWPGDLPLRTVAGKAVPGKTWALVGPHHGAPEDYKAANAQAMVETIGPRRAFLSLGTHNPHSHPRLRYVETLGVAGCQVACSQLTVACDRDRVLNKDVVFQGSGALGLRAPANGIACRGAWRATFRDGELLPDEFDAEHLQRLASLDRPTCIKSRGWRTGEKSPPQVL